MISPLVFCVLLVGTPAEDELSAKPPELKAYAAVKRKAGHDAEAQVRLALWCEAHGLSAERTKHLVLATLLDPMHAAARGLQGLVSYKGRWQAPNDVVRQVRDDPTRRALLRDYLLRRAATADKADDQWRLALWCEESGLKEQATAHYYQVLKHEPGRDAAWKRLGFKKVGGRWIKPEILSAQKAESEAQALATRLWTPRLVRWRDGLGSRDKVKKAAADESIGQITDHRAVPAVMSVLGRGSEAQQRVALKTLSQIDAPGASRALAMLAVFSGSAAIRGEAVAILRRRDVREFADFLIGLVQQPIEFEVKRVIGPGSSGELLIKGQGSRPNVRRIYTLPAAPDVSLQAGDNLVNDASGLPVIQRRVMGEESTLWLPAAQIFNFQSQPLSDDQKQRVMDLMAQSGLGSRAQQIGQLLITSSQNQTNMVRAAFFQTAWQAGQFSTPVYPTTQFGFTFGRGVEIPIGRMEAESQRTALAAEQQLERDAQTIRDYNNSFRELNDRVVPILQDVSGLDLGAKPQQWQNWFIDQIGFQSPPAKTSEPETRVEEVPLDYLPQAIPIGSFVTPISVSRISCFGAGTLVHTITGTRPIESLKVGDQVLTQNTRTGSLDYHPVLVVHRNPPSRTFKVTLGDETIVSSAFHRFWKAGQGWVMARDLVVGDPIRTLKGILKVASIEDGQVIPVFNLDIAVDADFFVGRSAALVHDNSLPDLRQPPFDGLTSKGTDGGSRPAEPSSASSGSSLP